MKARNRGTQGFVLAMALIVTMIILVISVAMITIGLYQSGISYNSSMNAGAQNAAMAGLDEAMDMLYHDPGWGTDPAVAGELEQKPLVHVNGSYTVTFKSLVPAGQYPFSTNNINGTADITRSDGIKVPKGYAYIVSTGKVAGHINKVAAMVEIPYEPCQVPGVVALNNISLGSVNAFNSSRFPVTKLNSRAAVGTNSISPGAISRTTIYGNAYVRGPITGGTSPIVTATLVAPGTVLPLPVVTYTVDSEPYPLAAAQAVPTHSSAASPITPGRYQALSGNHIFHLTEGKYSFESITLNGNAEIIISSTIPDDHQCYIYTNGDITLSGNVVTNNTNKPGKLKIAGGTGCKNITLSGNGAGKAQIYAPAADLLIHGGGRPDTPSLCGAAICNSITGNGANSAIWCDMTMSVTVLAKQQPRVSGFYNL